jgi:hypothetical protein
VDVNLPDTGTIYYYDDKIIVTKNMVTLGNPYNQAYNLATIHGVSHGRDNSGMIVRLMWFLLGAFGFLMGGILFSEDWTLTGGTIFLGSIGICWLAIRGSSRPFVELKFGGLNNQMLHMKRMDEAEALAVAIRMAMHDLNTPPEPGQTVYNPIFPTPTDPASRNPIFSRN